MREYIVFVSKDHYNPVGIVRTLGEAGIRPVAVVVKGDLRMVGKSKYVKKTYYVDSTEDGLKLIIDKFANSRTEKSFILTGDDVTVQMLDAHYDELKDFFYFYNAGEAGRIRHYMNKDVLNELAEKVGFKIPKTWRVKTGEIPEDIKYPIMTKAIHSFGKEWKDIVFICNSGKAVYSFIYHYVFTREIQKLLWCLLSRQRPETCAATTGHNNSIYHHMLFASFSALINAIMLFLN